MLHNGERCYRTLDRSQRNLDHTLACQVLLHHIAVAAVPAKAPRKVLPYQYRGPVELLEDFYREVERILRERGVR